MPEMTTCLWFDTEAEEAASFYTDVFPNSSVGDISRYGDAVPDRAGTALTVSFTLDGMPFVGLNGGPQFPFTEAVSVQVHTESEEETDRYWATLSEGGAEGRCGWLKDRFGLSWQIVPTAMSALLGDPDPGRATRAMQAMMGMSKIDIAEIRAAADRG